MAAPGSQDPLDVLQLMVNEVLVQTGKALRASRKDGLGNVAQAHGSLQNKLPDTIRTFHSALDDLEHDIIRAKSVLLRDLTQLQQQRQPVPVPEPEPEPVMEPVPEPVSQPQQQLQPPPQQQPQPIESQSKSPMVIDIDSSSPVNDHAMMDTKPPKQMAPFPDMGMGLPEVSQADVNIKEEPVSSAPPAVLAPQENDFTTEIKAEPAPMAPMPPMDEKSLEDGMDFTGGDTHVPDAELNFTDMQFTLAPTNNDNGNPSTTQEQSFDLTTFAPADGGDDLLSLDLLPPNPTDQSVTNPPMQEQPQETVKESIETKDDNMDSTFDDLFLLDSGGDFGGGNMEATFDDLMNDRGDDNGFDLMEHGKFDEAFFGLDSNMS